MLTSSGRGEGFAATVFHPPRASLLAVSSFLFCLLQHTLFLFSRLELCYTLKIIDHQERN